MNPNAAEKYEHEVDSIYEITVWILNYPKKTFYSGVRWLKYIQISRSIWWFCIYVLAQFYKSIKKINFFCFFYILLFIKFFFKYMTSRSMSTRKNSLDTDSYKNINRPHSPDFSFPKLTWYTFWVSVCQDPPPPPSPEPAQEET